MTHGKAFIAFLLLCFLSAPPLFAAEVGDKGGEGTIFTFWPLVDYRESPGERFSNLSILGPLFKFQRRGEERDIAVRPFFYESAHAGNRTDSTDYLYPVASTESTPEATRVQVLKLYQRNVYRKDEKERREESSTMLFPFYISGTSGKYGPYTSVFPLYGDIYERFWRDEYHYLLFPLYGRTVKKGTTTRNYLYPFFSTIEGERESGFQFWPLYGQSAKEGAYRRRFALWPLYMEEQSGLDTDTPTRKLFLFPFYAATDSPQRTSRSYLWPFFGYAVDTARKEEERDFLWPFLVTVRGDERSVDRYLPFYAEEKGRETLKRWYMWPLYRHDEIDSESFRQERDRVLYFLYSDRRESWPKDGAERRRVAFWPLFQYRRDEKGISALTLPAPIEPILEREGIERNWAPLWRLYQHRWNEAGDSAVSILWNLYWHERRGADLACEIFPLLFYRSEQQVSDVQILKGLVRYREADGARRVTFFWLPFGIDWGEKRGAAADGDAKGAGSGP